MIVTILTTVLGATAAQFILRNLMMLGIAAAVLAGSNAITGLVAYVKGHNAAAAKCQVATLKVERDQLKRDVTVQKSTSEFYQKRAAELEAKEAEREKLGAKDAEIVKPIVGCVVPERMRRNRAKR